MDLTVSTFYQLARDGQQYGPYQAEQLVQMAQGQQILPTDHLWAEGMAEWTPAQSFSQLAPIFAAASQQAATPSVARGTGVGSASAAAGANRIARKAPGRPGPAGRSGRSRPGSKSSASPRRAGKKGANFAILGWSLAAFLVGVSCVLVGAVLMGGSSPSLEEVSSEDFVMPEPSPAASALIMAGAILYPISLIVYGIVSLVFLHRGWSHLQVLPEVRTTPGKAIGFLFIPFFNIYWLFVAYYGWAMDYNILKQRSGVIGAPQVSGGLFLAFCIIALLFGPVLHPFVMHKICQGINFLAATPDEELVGGNYA